MTKPKNVFSFKTLLQMTYDLKQQGKRIGITHGAFDLFHYSHLDLLKQSSTVCDFLIVGIDSDDNVAEYKSYKRPIVKENERVAIISELHCVDATFICDFFPKSENFTNIYKELMVDIITIGRRFQFDEIMDEQVGRADAKLIRINTLQIPTTTYIIDSIINKCSPCEYKDVPIDKSTKT